jgi:hypothetical protein
MSTTDDGQASSPFSPAIVIGSQSPVRGPYSVQPSKGAHKSKSFSDRSIQVSGTETGVL